MREQLKAILVVAVLLTLVACGAPAPLQDRQGVGAGDMVRSLKYGNRSRSYLIHIPPGYDPKRATPVVLVFHGGLGNARNIQKVTKIDVVADEKIFIVVYPNGTGRFSDRLLTWNGGRCCGYAAEQKVDDVGFMRALLDDLETLVNVDPQRIYATGISNGAIMAYRLACELSDRIAAIGAVAGTQNIDVCAPDRPVPVLHIHGDRDAHVPYHGGVGVGLSGVSFTSVGETIAFWVRQNGCAPEPEVTQTGNIRQSIYSQCNQDATVQLIIVVGGGHAWPGGEPAWKGGDVPTQEINASEVLWAFFAAHPKQ
jgi:polyhydroxybutyrate depolymerase